MQSNARDVPNDHNAPLNAAYINVLALHDVLFYPQGFLLAQGALDGPSNPGGGITPTFLIEIGPPLPPLAHGALVGASPLLG